jgi:hypothetical protein
VADAQVNVPVNSLEEPPAPEPSPASSTPVSTGIVQTPAERETSDSALHAAPAWGAKQTPVFRRPLVDHDVLLHKKPVAAPAPVVAKPEEEESGEEDDRSGIGRMDFRGIRLSRSPMKLAFLLVGIVIILVFVISGLSNCRPESDVRPTPPSTDAAKELRTAVDPPAPYFD